MYLEILQTTVKSFFRCTSKFISVHNRLSPNGEIGFPSLAAFPLNMSIFLLKGGHMFTKAENLNEKKLKS